MKKAFTLKGSPRSITPKTHPVKYQNSRVKKKKILKIPRGRKETDFQEKIGSRNQAHS